MKKTYRCSVGESSHSFTEEELELWDIKRNSEGFHLMFDYQSISARIDKFCLDQKEVTVNIKGKDYQVKIEDQLDQLVKSMGLSLQSSLKVSEIKAPMPGLVLSVNVKSGQEVNAGDTLLILEAMKMENVIKSPVNAVIKSIHVDKGDTIDKGQVLIEME